MNYIKQWKSNRFNSVPNNKSVRKPFFIWLTKLFPLLSWFCSLWHSRQNRTYTDGEQTPRWRWKALGMNNNNKEKTELKPGKTDISKLHFGATATSAVPVVRKPAAALTVTWWLRATAEKKANRLWGEEKTFKVLTYVHCVILSIPLRRSGEQAHF